MIFTMKKLQHLKQHMSLLRWNATNMQIEQLLQEAQEQKPSYLEWLLRITQSEVDYRYEKAMDRRLKKAALPLQRQLEQFDFANQNGVSPQQLRQLRELLWLEQHYNLILMGPSGVGKTFIAAGLAYDAIKAGYDALFRTMQQVLDTLKLKGITRSAKAEYNRYLKAQLVVIDDMMMFPVEKNDANRLFHLVNHLHERSSIIITTNKSPKQWAEVLDDEVLATAMLDRLLYRCEIIQLKGKSYRLANRKTIFENTAQGAG
jgi:DNA replication protein DnaC